LQMFRPFDIIYKVRILDSGKATHIGGMVPGNEPDIANNYLTQLRSWAVRFWSGDYIFQEHDKPVMEVITGSSAEVISMVDHVV